MGGLGRKFERTFGLACLPYFKRILAAGLKMMELEESREVLRAVFGRYFELLNWTLPVLFL